MAAKFEPMAGRSLLQQLFDITAQQVLRRPALHAEQVMVVSPVAELVVKIAVFQQHPAEHAGLNKQL